MLQIHGCDGNGGACDVTVDEPKLPSGSLWLDVLKPDERETALVERTTGFKLPSFEELSEVEISSRLRRSGKAIYLALPLVFRDPKGVPKITPVGLILSADHLVTIRFEELKAFEACRARVDQGEVHRPSSVAVFVALLEAIVDRLADILEEVGTQLDVMADEVFGKDLDRGANHRPKQQDARLRNTLRRVGRSRQLISKVRATLLAISRIVPYVEGEGEEWLPHDAVPRLETVLKDVGSLDEYENHLSDKVQFLLDADLGLINIEQNDRFRILTVVSVVGIPPTLVASLYGMNFKHMPELEWIWGYPYGLTLIALSALVPLVYFRKRGWF
ncbi:magnesium transporter CorA family protein [uncultured Enterovirga sp.]|uniref:magnesium transporter CorA family protein n=1 Tax=uncultured Enterovirga sp. TaxID=2026352 RepID=UPI0035CC4992